MIMTEDANKITRLIGFNPQCKQASKNFKSNRLLRIFGSSNSISKTFVNYLNQLGMSGYSISARNYSQGYSGGKERQGSRRKVFPGYLAITRLTGNKSKNDRCKYLSIGMFRWQGIAKVTGTRSRENIGEYLRILLVHGAIIWSEGFSRRKY